MKPGGPALWGNAFKRAVNAHVELGYSTLVGVFHTEYGALNRGTVVYFCETVMNVGDHLWFWGGSLNYAFNFEGFFQF